MMKYVFGLDSGSALSPERRRELLGGKGASLVDMVGMLRLPVPRAAILSTEAGRHHLHHGFDATLREDVRNAVALLEAETGRCLGSADNPLVVSVRSAGYHSMPGMLDTVLNVGFTLAYCERADSASVAGHRLQCLSVLLDGLMADAPAEGMDTVRQQIRLIGAEAATIGHMEDYCVLRNRLQEQAERAGRSSLLVNVEAQLEAAVIAVFDSWRSHRATIYRQREGIAQDGGTAAIIQCMVFGNRNKNSGTGVIFSRDPNSGEPGAYGDFLVCAQGEAVVSGSAQGSIAVSTMGTLFPAQYRQLMKALEQLEQHYRDMVDVEFTIDDGTLWILQARPGKRSPLAALRVARDLAEDGRFGLTADAIRARVGPALMRYEAARTADARSVPALASGLGVATGLACGAIYMTADNAEAAIERDERILYVRQETAPDDVPIMAVAEGVITSTGGAASHAAVIARAWGKPTVVGVEAMSHSDTFIYFGDVRVNQGEVLTIDGGTGAIYRGEVGGRDAESDSVSDLIAWAERFMH